MTENKKLIKLIQEGDKSLRNDDFDAAEKKYKKALSYDPKSAEVLYSIGAVYTNRGDLQTALEWAELAVVADPNFKPAHALLGNVLFGLNRYEDALTALARADESNLIVRAQVGLCYEKLESWEKAEEYFRAVLETDPAYMTRYSMMAMYDHSPFPADVHHALARVLQHQGKIKEAKLHYHLTKRIDPTTPLDPMYLEIMSESDLENHPFFNEEESEKPSVKSQPADKLIYLFRLSDYTELYKEIQEYKSEDFISDVALIINAYQQKGKFYRSAQSRVIIDLLNGAERADLFAALQSHSWERLFELAEMVHTKSIPSEESLKLIKELEFDFKNSDLLLDLTSRFINLEPGTGLTLTILVDKLLTRSPDKSDAGLSRVLLGKAYYYTRKLEKATGAFNEAFIIFTQENDHEGMLNSLNWLGHVQTDTEKFPDALNTFDKYIQLAENYGKTENILQGRYNRARTLLLADRAAESYEEFLKVASNIQEVGAENELRGNLAKLMLQAAEKAGKSVQDEVLNSLRNEANLQGESIETLLSQARIDQENGDLAKALFLLKKARNMAEHKAPLRRRKYMVRVLTDMGTLLGKMEREKEAVNVLLEALHLGEPISAEEDIWPILVKLGILSSHQGNKDEAITYLERALQEARQLRSRDREGQSLYRLSQILKDVDPVRAREYLDELYFGNFLKGPQEKDLPQDWVEGMNAMQAGRFIEGIAALKRLCLDMNPTAKTLCPEALANCGIAYSHLNEIPEAIDCWEKAADMWLKHGDHNRVIDVLGRIAHLHKQEGEDYSEILNRMLKIWEEIDDIITRRTVGLKLAEIAFDLGEFVRSENALKEVLSITTSEEGRDIIDEMKVRITLGKIYRQTSRYQEAIEQYHKALACAQYLKDEPAEGIIRGWMGIAYRYLDKLDSAVEQYQRAIDIAESYYNVEAAAEHRMNLAASLFLLCHDEEGKNTALEALAAFDNSGQEEMASRVMLMLLQYVGWEALPPDLQTRIETLMDEKKESGDPILIGFISTKQAQMLASKGDIEGAQLIMEKVIGMYGEIGDYFNQASAFLNQARILEEYDTAQANTDATQALDLAKSIGQMHLIMDCQEFLLNVALGSGDDSQINHYLKSALDGWIRLRRRLKNDRDRITFIDRISNITRRCVAYFLQNGQIIRAFELQEWGRAQALNDLLAESVVTSMPSNKKEVRDLLANESEILNSMKSQERVNLDLTPLTEGIEKSKELIRDLEAELTAVYKALEIYDPYYVLQKVGVPVDMVRVKALLTTFNRPSVIVTLGFVGDEIVAMTLRPDQITPSVYLTGMNQKRVKKLLETFNEEIHFYCGEGVETWRDLAAPLLHSAADSICEDDLVVLVPEENLQQLPLHAIKLPNGQFLFERAAIVYTPNLTVLEVLQRSRTGQEKQFSRFMSVGVAFPDEARAVSLSFGNIGKCLSGNNLAKDDLQNFLFGNSILHFACHGYFNPKHYLDSGLLLRITETPLRKDILSLRDIMTWHLDSDLVILSACETGRGTVAPSEFLGLSRGFLAAGAQSVIVALWKIDNDATQAFMLTFYENLQRQLKESDTIDLAEALRRTQNQYAKSSMFHWAGFKLIGQPTIVWKGGMK